MFSIIFYYITFGVFGTIHSLIWPILPLIDGLCNLKLPPALEARRDCRSRLPLRDGYIGVLDPSK